MLSTACTGSVPVMTPTLTSTALGDTSLLHALDFVLFAQDSSSLQGHFHRRFPAHSSPAGFPLTGLTPQMHPFPMLLTLFHCKVVAAMQGPLLRWSSGSLNLCHPRPRPVSCHLNLLHLKFNEIPAFTSVNSAPALLTSPASRAWSFEEAFILSAT